MNGIIECGRATAKTIKECLKEPSEIFSPDSLSPRTQLVLQVACSLVLSEAETQPKFYRYLSNFIYYANNYFDIGLRLKEETFQNRHGVQLALEQISQTIKQALEQARTALCSLKPEAANLIDIYLYDGQVLNKYRHDFPPLTYREIDSGLTALLVIGIAGGQEQLDLFSLDSGLAAADAQQLYQKYALFRTSDLRPSKIPSDEKTRSLIGLQAIEMILVVLDDQWGEAEDKLLDLPNTFSAGLNSDELIKHYITIASACGFSPLSLALISNLFYLHKLRVSHIKPGQTIEPQQIQKYKHLDKICLLREWLNAHGLLVELLS